MNFFGDVFEGTGQRHHRRPIAPQQVQHQARGGALADPGEARELSNEDPTGV